VAGNPRPAGLGCAGSCLERAPTTTNPGSRHAPSATAATRPRPPPPCALGHRRDAPSATAATRPRPPPLPAFDPATPTSRPLLRPPVRSLARPVRSLARPVRSLARPAPRSPAPARPGPCFARPA